MNLEKAMNKNMFDVSNAVREPNQLQTTDPNKCETNDSSIGSILTHPKQKLTAQFKRAITMIKQRSEPTNETATMYQTSPTSQEKPVHSFDSTGLASLIEEPLTSAESSTSQKSSFISIKPIIENSLSFRETDSSSATAATIVNLDPYGISSTGNVPRKSLQQIHSSIIQTIHHQPSQSSSSSPFNANATPTGTGEITILETLL